MKKSSKSSAVNEFNNPAAVIEIINNLDEPLRSLVSQLTNLVLNSDKNISTGIKWNSPSFWCKEWFATINFRTKSGINLILHHGATPHPESEVRNAIKDKSELLKWHSPDRASILIKDIETLEKIAKPLSKIIKDWVKYHSKLHSSKS